MTNEVVDLRDRPAAADPEEDDDDYRPPVAIRATGTRIEICPVCSTPLKKHGVVELSECAAQIERDDEDEVAPAVVAAPPRDDSAYNRPGNWFLVHTQLGYEAKVKQFIEVRKDARVHEVVEKRKIFPGYVLLRCDMDDELWRTVRATPDVQNFVGTSGSRPSPLSRNDVDKFLTVDDTGPLETAGAYGRQIAPAADAPTTEGDVSDLWTSAEPFPMDEFGEVDYEKLVPLAAAMRTVLERERDEIIRRGGPIEKQNIELKERLAAMLEDMQALRRKLQMTAESRNMLQEQVDRQTKEIRKLRNELKGRKENNHVHLNEISDILAVVDKTKGWSREMGGNGHWQIYKAGVFVSDAAGSGGSTRVNQATRVKLRKAGLEV